MEALHLPVKVKNTTLLECVTTRRSALGACKTHLELLLECVTSCNLQSSTALMEPLKCNRLYWSCYRFQAPMQLAVFLSQICKTIPFFLQKLEICHLDPQILEYASGHGNVGILRFLELKPHFFITPPPGLLTALCFEDVR